MVRKVWLDEVSKLRVDVERITDFRHAGRLVLLLFALTLPELLLGGLARRGARVDGGARAAWEQGGFGGGLAVV